MTDTEPVSETYEFYSCRICSDYTTSRNGLPSGWVNEVWPTIGGGIIRRHACFSCRDLVSHEAHPVIEEQL